MRDEGEAQELDDHRPDERAQIVARPARKRRAANRDRRDGVELHVFADPMRIGRAIDGHHDQPSQPGQESADAVDRHLDLVHRNAGQARRRGIAPRRQHVAAKRRRTQHPHGHDDDHQHDDDLEANAENLAQPDELEVRIIGDPRLRNSRSSPLTSSCAMPRPPR